MWSREGKLRLWGLALGLWLLVLCPGCGAEAQAAGTQINKTAGALQLKYSREPYAFLARQPLAEYAGWYEPYAQKTNDRQNGDSMWHGLSLGADGVVNGWAPEDISYQEDGAVRLIIGTDQYFTLYPIGVVSEDFPSVLDSSNVKLVYADYRKGILEVAYYKTE